MKKYNVEDFRKYLSGSAIYLYNPLCEVAFKDVYEDSRHHLYCKRKGGEEKLIDIMDEDFEIAFNIRIVMTKTEYDNF